MSGNNRGIHPSPGLSRNASSRYSSPQINYQNIPSRPEDINRVPRNPNMVQSNASSISPWISPFMPPVQLTNYAEQLRLGLLGAIPHVLSYEHPGMQANQTQESHANQQKLMMGSTTPSKNSGQNSSEKVSGVSPARNTEEAKEKHQKMEDFRDPEKLLRMFRSVECQCCQRHFGFQSRTKRDELYCSVACLGQEQDRPPSDQVEISATALSGDLTPQHIPDLSSRTPSAPLLSVVHEMNGYHRGIGDHEGIRDTRGLGESRNFSTRANNERTGFSTGRGGFIDQGGSYERGGGSARGRSSDRGGGGFSERGGPSNDRGGSFGVRGGNNSGDRGYQNGDRGGYNSDRGNFNGGRGNFQDRGGYGGRGGQSGTRGGYNGDRGGRRGGSGTRCNENNSDDSEWVIPGNESADVTDTCRTENSITVTSVVASVPKVDKTPQKANVDNEKVTHAISGLQLGSGSQPTCGSDQIVSAPRNIKLVKTKAQTEVFATENRSLPEEGTKEYKEIQKVACNPFLETFPAHERSSKLKLVTLPSSFPTVEVEKNMKLSGMSDEIGWAQLEIGIQQVLEKSYSNSCRDFYVQTYDGNKISTLLIDEIYEYITKSKKLLEDMSVKSLCLAPFEGTYFRAEIIEKNGTPPVYTVFFCDYGNEAKVSGDDLFEMPVVFKAVPRCAINCKWDMAEAKELSDEQLNALYEKPGIPLTPKLKIAEGQYLVSLSPFVPKSSFVIKDLVKPRAKPPLEESKISDAPLTGLSTLSMSPASSNPAAPTPKLKLSGSSPASKELKPSGPKIWNIKNCTYSPNIKNFTKVQIGFSWSLTRYLITAVADSTASTAVQVAIVNGTFEPFVGTPKLGDILLGLYEGEYYRGQVVNFNDVKATLEFIDFGDKATINLNELRVPTNDLMTKYPIYGLNVVLSEVGEEPPGIPASVEVATACESVLQIVFSGEPTNDIQVQLWVNDDNSLNSLVKKSFVDAYRKLAAS